MLRNSLGADLFCLLAILAIAGCEGDGSGGAAPKVILRSTPECIVFAGGFPSGAVLLPGAGNEAAVVQFIPTAVLGLDLDREPPQLLTSNPIPGFPELRCDRCGGILQVDSDSDGEPDACRSDELGFSCLSPAAGSLLAIDDSLVALSTSSYEQIVLLDPQDGGLRDLDLDTPSASATFDPADFPFWPPVGTRPTRSALSTRACVYGDGLFDSLADPVGPSPFCDPARNGFVTRFTAGAALAGDRLFVATSNLVRSSRAQFDPGTVLVFEFDQTVDPPVARPDAATPILLTSGFNPTSVTPYTTPSGRHLVLVAVSGAIALDTGPDLVRTESAIDVIDAATRRLIATIPLGLAGLGFAPIAVDATNRLGLMGAATSRALFGIDLAALDDPLLGLGPEPLPIVLDGSTPGFLDARIFDADAPFVLPRRPDGPPPNQCATQTSVALARTTSRGVTTDFCDGTVSVLSLSLPASRTASLDPLSLIAIERVQNVAAPIVDDATGQLRAIDRALIRPGTPGLDFSGPDVYFTAGLPEGAVCGVRVDAL
ncbi:MAG: hypothetical protein CL908_15685 [Deltaproteobacteria bacterium]|nr:hypothetical protein [Deltaproteobacteria bacterium]